MKEATLKRLEVLQDELDSHLLKSTRIQEIIAVRKRLSIAVEKYFALGKELEDNPESKEAMSIVDGQIMELQKIIENEHISEEEVSAYIKKTDDLLKKLSRLQDDLYPQHPEWN